MERIRKGESRRRSISDTIAALEGNYGLEWMEKETGVQRRALFDDHQHGNARVTIYDSSTKETILFNEVQEPYMFRKTITESEKAELDARYEKQVRGLAPRVRLFDSGPERPAVSPQEQPNEKHTMRELTELRKGSAQPRRHVPRGPSQQTSARNRPEMTTSPEASKEAVPIEAHQSSEVRRQSLERSRNNGHQERLPDIDMDEPER